MTTVQWWPEVNALTSLHLTVNSFADLVKMLRSGYGGRAVDVLVMRTGA
jgi:hypothetical protein